MLHHFFVCHNTCTADISRISQQGDARKLSERQRYGLFFLQAMKGEVVDDSSSTPVPQQAFHPRCHRYVLANRLLRLINSSSSFIQYVLNSLGKADLCTDGVDVLAVGKRAILRVAGVRLCGHNWYRQVLVTVSQLQ